MFDTNSLKDATLDTVREHPEGITHPQLVTALLQKGYKTENFSEDLFQVVGSLIREKIVKKNKESRTIKMRNRIPQFA